MIHWNISTKTILLTKTFVAKLTSFELASTLSYEDTAESKNNPDLACFRQVLMEVISCKYHEKGQSQSPFESMQMLANLCMSEENPSSSNEILKEIEYCR